LCCLLDGIIMVYIVPMNVQQYLSSRSLLHSKVNMHIKYLKKESVELFLPQQIWLTSV
jgi:hypothetical protein